jgi:hypothetical protein
MSHPGHCSYTTRLVQGCPCVPGFPAGTPHVHVYTVDARTAEELQPLCSTHTAG